MGPQPTTLEMKHVIRKNFSDYSNVLSIRRNYCVTDKADGERNLLFVLSNESAYMINRKNEIKTIKILYIIKIVHLLDNELNRHLN